MSRRKGPTGVRRKRIGKMHSMLKGAGEVGLDRFIATCEYQMGLTRGKIMEYLGILERLELVKMDEGADTLCEVEQTDDSLE